MALRPSKRGSRPEVDAELNLLPILNLMVGLVPPLLLMASFIHLAVIDSSLPKIDQAPPPDKELPETIPLVLTVELFTDQVRATCTGGIKRDELKNYKPGESTCGEITVGTKKVEPDESKGEKFEPYLSYDWYEFSKKMVELKNKYPDDNSVIIRPVDEVRYLEIVNAMDYTRQCHEDLEVEDPADCVVVPEGSTVKLKRKLFPAVNLAFAVEETGGLISQ